MARTARRATAAGEWWSCPSAGTGVSSSTPRCCARLRASSPSRAPRPSSPKHPWRSAPLPSPGRRQIAFDAPRPAGICVPPRVDAGLLPIARVLPGPSARDARRDPRARRRRHRAQPEHPHPLRRGAPGALRRPRRPRQDVPLRGEHPGVLRPLRARRLRLPRRLPPARAARGATEERHMSYLSTTDFAEDQAFVERFRRTMKGDLELSWMDEPRERVRCRPQNERRGLTFRDLDVGTYGFTEMPELIRQNRSFAPRGAAQPPGLPDLQAEVNRKTAVWAYNIEGYYEDAMTRQWNATTDIPWAELQETELPEEIGKAYAQLLTFLTEVEMIATDVPAKWMGRLNADFFEVKNFIATQAMDEARHAEIFRKRALSTGWGLMRASAHNEFNLKFLRDADSFAEASLALHLQAEGMVLTLFRFSEYISPTEGDKKLFRLVMQDEARHVGYW